VPLEVLVDAGVAEAGEAPVRAALVGVVGGTVLVVGEPVASPWGQAATTTTRAARTSSRSFAVRGNGRCFMGFQVLDDVATATLGRLGEARAASARPAPERTRSLSPEVRATATAPRPVRPLTSAASSVRPALRPAGGGSGTSWSWLPRRSGSRPAPPASAGVHARADPCWFLLASAALGRRAGPCWSCWPQLPSASSASRSREAASCSLPVRRARGTRFSSVSWVQS
jgi:hypothetical protein